MAINPSKLALVLAVSVGAVGYYVLNAVPQQQATANAPDTASTGAAQVAQPAEPLLPPAGNASTLTNLPPSATAGTYPSSANTLTEQQFIVAEELMIKQLQDGLYALYQQSVSGGLSAAEVEQRTNTLTEAYKREIIALRARLPAQAGNSAAYLGSDSDASEP